MGGKNEFCRFVSMEYFYFDLDWRMLPRLMSKWTGKDLKATVVDDWMALKPTTPFGSLPILKREGKSTLAQAVVIHSYLAKGTSLCSQDEEDELPSQMLHAFSEDILNDLTKNKYSPDKTEAWNKYLDPENNYGLQ